MYEKDYWKVKRNKKLFEDILKQLKRMNMKKHTKLCWLSLLYQLLLIARQDIFIQILLKNFLLV